MTATIEEEAPVRPFNAYAAYEAARDENRNLWAALIRSLALIDSNADRLERRGEDVAHLRTFSRNTRARVLG